ncbi:MAG: hypothetical protein II781_00120 [Clostridia bacterium]|nr:hypothetical protein [Clostridia bacterium]
MQNIWISDVTMKQPAAEGGFTLSFREKIELAKMLDRLHVDVIETAPIQNKRTDSLLIKSIAGTVKESTVAVPLSLTEADTLDITWSALKEAVRPRLQIVAPVSTVQMEYLCHLKPAAMLQKVVEMIAAAKTHTAEIEFVAEDAGRSDPEYLREILLAAVDAGATVVTVCDTAGIMLPEEFHKSIKIIRDYLPEQVRLGVLCSNELYIADAVAMDAVLAGAGEVKVSSGGDYTASLEKLIHILAVKGSEYGVGCRARTTELHRTATQIRRMYETHRSKLSPFDNGVRDEKDEVELTIHDDISAVVKAAEKLGYEISEEDASKVYEAFTRIASMKTVNAKELDAIVASSALQVPPTYRVEDYIINSGNTITATSHIRMRKGEQLLDGLAVGDGPIDASFLAIEQIVGTHYELDDFQIQAVTEGREAMGETVIRLRSGGKVYAGRGISTDIIGAAIEAYVSAVNKIVYEEGE